MPLYEALKWNVQFGCGVFPEWSTIYSALPKIEANFDAASQRGKYSLIVVSEVLGALTELSWNHVHARRREIIYLVSVLRLVLGFPIYPSVIVGFRQIECPSHRVNEDTCFIVGEYFVRGVHLRNVGEKWFYGIPQILEKSSCHQQSRLRPSSKHQLMSVFLEPRQAGTEIIFS